MTLIAIDQLFKPATSQEWNTQTLASASVLDLKVTSWQAGQPSRTMIAIMSQIFAQQDATVSLMAQGGFLTFAATGSVTYTALNGKTVTQKVTPDPSIPGENPDGIPGWLDVLAESVYDEVRTGAVYASNTLYLANTSANSYGPFSPGTYHASNPLSSAGYSNVEALTIGPAQYVGGPITGATNTGPIVITTTGVHGLSGSEVVRIANVLGNTAANGFWSVNVLSTTTFALVGSTGNGSYVSGGTVNVCYEGTFAADAAGPGGTSAPGTITQPVTTLSGVSCENLGSFIGSAWESNDSLAAKCRLKIQALSPNGPKGAYEYFALKAAELLAAEDPPVALSAPITRVLKIADAQTGVMQTVIANAAGDVEGISNLAVSGATNATPIVITTGTHGLATGNYATLSGVLGNTNANGTHTITVINSTSFSLDGTSGNAAYTGGGIVQGGDLGQVDKIIQENAVPDPVPAITTSSIPFNVAVVGTVEVPQANVPIYSAAVQTSLAILWAVLPIGGVNGALQYNSVVGVVEAAGIVGEQPSYVKRLTSLTLNGVSTDVNYPGELYVAKLSPAPVINVVGV